MESGTKLKLQSKLVKLVEFLKSAKLLLQLTGRRRRRRSL